MPHKRAKRSVREADRKEKGSDLPPKVLPADLEAIPKGIARVLNAEAVRADWRERKRKREADEEQAGSTGGKKRKVKVARDDNSVKPGLRLQEGESLAQFNRRVEQLSQTKVPTPGRNSKRKARTSDAASAPSLPPKQAAQPRKTEFDSLPRTTRLNDVAQAPPTLTKAPRNAAKITAGKRAVPVSMSMQKALDEERAKLVERYREIRDNRRTAQTQS